MSKQKFELYNTQVNVTIARVEMDEGLLKPEAGILDHETMTLKNLRHGAIYTLIPMPDPTVAALSNIKDAYENLKNREVPDFSSAIGRMDNVIHAIDLLFGEVEFHVVESAKDLENLIQPTNMDDPPPTVTYKILGGLDKALSDYRGEGEKPENDPISL